MQKSISILFLALYFLLFGNCSDQPTPANPPPVSPKIPVLFDTDANNELDDQHALAYLLLNEKTFDVKGITVNATSSGGDIEGHYTEADRILTLCNKKGEIPLLKGANSDFLNIREQLQQNGFDGQEAVDFIIQEAHKAKTEKLVVLAVGKLTNVALATQKDPSITSNIRLVWLGSNYPEAGEYNQDNDTASMSYLLQSNIPFEMVTVRYGKPSGTDAVKVTKTEALQRMPGMGPKATTPITGRHGGSFNRFGDYSVNLFEHIEYYGDPPARALFDMAAVAIVKNPNWAEQRSIPSPVLKNNQWIEQPDNDRKILLWENFKRDEIISDFYQSLEVPKK